ncbi:acyl carrier protein [Actinophytocola sp.]|uniref:acyl carrier protein n=1 Tax=Actinophytocola sp. TaxID=1872138 RepID=UPI0025B8BF34|nr:acyl carrier protein [Actinophytocola sp.]
MRAVIAAVFGIAPGELPERASPETVAGWSSLRQVRIMLALEQEFGVEIDPNLIPALTSDGAMTAFVADLVAENAA